MQISNRLAAICGGALVVLALAIVSKPAITAVYSTPMRNVENPARYPVQVQDAVTMAAGEYGASKDIYTVPDGYRLVIDNIRAMMNLPSGQTGRVVIIAHSPASVSVDVPLVWATWNGEPYAVGTTMTRIYADPGTKVTLCAYRSGTTGYGYLSPAGFSGHLVPLP